MKRTTILALGISVAIVIVSQAVLQPRFKELTGAIIDVFVPGYGVEGLHDPTPEAAADEPVIVARPVPVPVSSSSSSDTERQ